MSLPFFTSWLGLSFLFVCLFVLFFVCLFVLFLTEIKQTCIKAHMPSVRLNIFSENYTSTLVKI